MAWALILAVSLYPAHQMFARRLGGRDGLAATLLVLLGIVLIVAPTTVLAMALGDSIQGFAERVSDHSLQVPEPPASVAAWPVIGAKAHALWSQAHTDLPSLVMSLQPYLGDISKKALGAAAADRRVGAAVPVLLRHRRGHDGLRPVGRGRHPLGLRPRSSASSGASASPSSAPRPSVPSPRAFSASR